MGGTHQEKMWGQNIPGRRPVKSEELGSIPDATINSLLALRQVSLHKDFNFMYKIYIMSILTSQAISDITEKRVR